MKKVPSHRVPSDLEQALVAALRSWVRRPCHLPLPPTLVRPLDLTSGSLGSLGCSRLLQKEGSLQRTPGERLPPIPSAGLGKWSLREHAEESEWRGYRLGLSDPSPACEVPALGPGFWPGLERAWHCWGSCWPSQLCQPNSPEHSLGVVDLGGGVLAK